MAKLDTNYFVCTLGQAAQLTNQSQHQFETVSDLIDSQAREFPDVPAIGFPIPSETGKWAQRIFSQWTKLHTFGPIF